MVRTDNSQEDLMIRLCMVAAETALGELQYCASLLMISSYLTYNSIERLHELLHDARKVVQQPVPSSKHAHRPRQKCVTYARLGSIISFEFWNFPSLEDSFKNCHR